LRQEVFTIARHHHHVHFPRVVDLLRQRYPVLGDIIHYSDLIYHNTNVSRAYCKLNTASALFFSNNDGRPFTGGCRYLQCTTYISTSVPHILQPILNRGVYPAYIKSLSFVHYTYPVLTSPVLNPDIDQRSSG